MNCRHGLPLAFTCRNCKIDYQDMTSAIINGEFIEKDAPPVEPSIEEDDE